ncbi:MAG: hypothetical protein M1269_10710 [Chloroflexi bacterium]|nr:hypothetical protein [Chloroflexota bacterium]
MKSGAIKYRIPILLAALFYFAAGFFIDLPPYGILLKSTDTRLTIKGNMVTADSTLTYKSRSWRSRQNDLYLPFSFSNGEGKIADFRAEVPGPSNFKLFNDGVMLRLVMKPKEASVVKFHFRQGLGKNKYLFIFDTPRGWFHRDISRKYTVEAPADGRKFNFSPEPYEESLSEIWGKPLYKITGKNGKGLMITWE